MRDPHEGLDSDGFITTGVRRDRVSRVYEPVLEAATASLVARLSCNGNVGCQDAVELHLYGSVATGMARPNGSDVDLFTIGVSGDAIASLSGELSRLFASLCRGVEIGAGQPNNYVGESDAAYGNRVFLRHYSVCLYGSDSLRSDAPFRGDAHAARGFNGDIGRCLTQWRQAARAGPGATYHTKDTARSCEPGQCARFHVDDRSCIQCSPVGGKSTSLGRRVDRIGELE